MRTQISNFTLNGVHLGIDPKMIFRKMGNFMTCILMLTTGTFAYGQMGINTTNPNTSSVLDIRPDLPNGNMGVLLPRVTTIQRLNPTKPPAERLLVIDTDLNMFMYYIGGTWYSLNGFKTTVTDKSGSKDTLSKHTGTAVFSTSKPDSNAIIVNGDAKFNGKINSDINSTGNLIGAKVYGEGTMPAGAIIMWSGSINNIPQGWALCDGGGGRPDLRGRFIVGYDKDDADYNAVSKTGPNFTDADGTSDGSNSQDAKQVKLLSSQSGLPSHTHGVIDKGHQHNYTIHTFEDEDVPDRNIQNVLRKANFNGTSLTESAKTGITIDYSQSLNASSSFENRPPYYVLAYIIKLNY